MIRGFISISDASKTKPNQRNIPYASAAGALLLAVPLQAVVREADDAHAAAWVFFGCAHMSHRSSLPFNMLGHTTSCRARHVMR